MLNLWSVYVFLFVKFAFVFHLSFYLWNYFEGNIKTREYVGRKNCLAFGIFRNWIFCLLCFISKIFVFGFQVGHHVDKEKLTTANSHTNTEFSPALRTFCFLLEFNMALPRLYCYVHHYFFNLCEWFADFVGVWALLKVFDFFCLIFSLQFFTTKSMVSQRNVPSYTEFFRYYCFHMLSFSRSNPWRPSLIKNS